MKYYGIQKKIRNEDLLYVYAKSRERILGIIPGINRKYHKKNYEYTFCNSKSIRKSDNSLPSGHYLKMDQIVVMDLVRRENIKTLQDGLKKLIMKLRADNRFIAMPIDGLNDIIKKIDSMDSSLLLWYNRVNCGVFDFAGTPLVSGVDYFKLTVSDLNSSFLGIECRIHLTKEKQDEIVNLISSDFHDNRGFVRSALASKKTHGTFKSYGIVYYNDEALKSDKLYETISYIEWDFFNELNRFLPLELHNIGIMPPRIEVFLTDISYYDDNLYFWDSVGISEYNGQFINDKHKVFFKSFLSERYSDKKRSQRLLYIANDVSQDKSSYITIKEEINWHLDECAREYFRFLMLYLVSIETGRIVIEYKHKLDRIKLQKNKLYELLKLRYNFEKDIDAFNRFRRDNDWKHSKKNLLSYYKDNDNFLKKVNRPLCYTCQEFCDEALADAKKIDDDIKILVNEFNVKQGILQHLSNYRSTRSNLQINVLMVTIGLLTLFYVIFPGKAVSTAEIIKSLAHNLSTIFKRIFLLIQKT